jgi:hypothetical protein
MGLEQSVEVSTSLQDPRCKSVGVYMEQSVQVEILEMVEVCASTGDNLETSFKVWILENEPAVVQAGDCNNRLVVVKDRIDLEIVEESQMHTVASVDVKSWSVGRLVALKVQEFESVS